MKTWHHIAVTAVSGKDSVIYVNGVEKARGKNKGSATTTSTIYIGDLRVDRKISFNGIMDEVIFFNAVLSQADIAKLAAGSFFAVSSSGKTPTTWGFIKDKYK